jgi:alpha-L-fucosidase
LAVLWYDGGWRGRFNVHPTRMREINDMVRELQPQILINGRCVIPGDFDTPEQTIPANGIVGLDGLPMPWESCMTLAGGSWGYTKDVTNYKTAKDVVLMLADIVSKGGNLLLNVGPSPEGVIGPRETETLEATGRWLDKYGECIYGTTPSPFRPLPFNGRITVKGNTLYAIIFDWPKDGEIVLPRLKNQIRGARLLGDSGSKISSTRRGENVVVRLPRKSPDAIASVVAIELDGVPVVGP